LKKLIFASKNNYWSNYLYDQLSINDPRWQNVRDNDELRSLDLGLVDYIFFFHWSDIVSSEIYDNCECVVIHTSNLPEGKGGSPIQNQIMGGIIQSNVNLLRMSRDVDAGPIYCSSPITLQGSLFDVWMSIAKISSCLIRKCVDENLEPQHQSEPTSSSYRRRKDNTLPLDNSDINVVYNFIQMLDAEGYPDSNIVLGNYSLHFSRAKILSENEMLCDVRIKKL
tara:strand:- start:1200 stop:1871 length:672 start_codon:yes stop_codon:yes gene_type:complete